MIQRRILVAVDGSAATVASVTVAAEFATRWAAGLDIVHVVGAPVWPRAQGPDPLPGAVAAAAEAAPAVAVRALARTGDASSVLIELARDYDLVVLGSRGHGALADAAWGSHAFALAGSVRCPVLVVRPGADRRRRRGPVVAALAGDDADADVLDLAFSEAAQRGVSVVATHGRGHRTLNVGRLVLAAAASHVAPPPAGAVSGELVPWRERYPDVPVQVDVRPGSPPAAVLEAARGAGLLVVGSRGRGSRSGLVLGSVSQEIVHHAHCPVAIVSPTMR